MLSELCAIGNPSYDGAVNVSTTPQVGYSYADGSENTIRPTGMVYPNGRVLSYGYGTSGGIDDRASRIASIIDDDDTDLVDYRYLGRQMFVEQDDTEPQMKWTLVDLTGTDDPDTGDIYSGLDRFGRVKDNRWYNYDALADVDRIQYGYDRAGNRLWRRNTVAAALGKEFDEIYVYDGVHRLREMVRGSLNTDRTALTSETFAQCWSLDSTGNWQGFREDTDGNGTWDLVQSRTANAVNEMTDLTNSVGSPWASPAYNRAGNMTTIPKPADPTQGYTATYDAWNRLVRIEEDEETVSQYAYDGAKRRILQISGSGLLSVDTRHFYYTEPSKWQVIEERMGTSPDASAAERQFVWGLRYIDDLVVRDRDANGDESLEERLYAMQDGNWNVTGLIECDGGLQERYAYQPHGIAITLTGQFEESSATSLFDYQFCGYRTESIALMYSARRRVYLLTLGCWSSRDPLKYSKQINYYSSGNTLLSTDPFGLQPMAPPLVPPPRQQPTYPLDWNRDQTILSMPHPVLSHPGHVTDIPPGSSFPPGFWDKPQITPTPGTLDFYRFRRRCWRSYLDSCPVRHAYPACPEPIESPEDVANQFLNQKRFSDPNMFIDGAYYSIAGCVPRQGQDGGPNVCPNGAPSTSVHCRAIVYPVFGARPWITDDLVSVFTCNCCLGDSVSSFPLGNGTPHNFGRPHWANQGIGIPTLSQPPSRP